MLTIRAESGNKVKVRFEDGSEKVLLRLPGGLSLPIDVGSLVGVTEEEARVQVRRGLFVLQSNEGAKGDHVSAEAVRAIILEDFRRPPEKAG